MKQYIENQYAASLGMLRSCVGQFDDDLWLKAEGYSNPAWQIAYHAIFFANVYCAPEGEAIVKWSKEVEHVEMLGKTPWPPHEKIIPVTSFSRKETLEYLDHVASRVPGYLESFSPDEPCWPFWYKLSQLEFQFNSLRHLSHHIGQLLERQSSLKPVEVQWARFE